MGTLHFHNLIMKFGLSLALLSAYATASLPASTIPEDALTKTFQKCDLASQLLAYGGAFTKSNIGDWICLTYYESSWKTSSKGGPNYDGSYDYGLFQINDYYWCYASSPSSAQKYSDCNINCSNLLDDNITDDEKCATTIYNRHGFDAWYGWINNCKGKDNSDWVSDCNLVKRIQNILDN